MINDATLTGTPPGAAGDATKSDPTTLLVEHYEVVEELAHGGLGRVLVARDRRLDRRVALKVPLHAAADVQHFRREVEITSRLQHPSIVPLYEAGRLPTGEPFFAMKLIEGRPLSKAISDAGSALERLALLPGVIAVAEAIAYAHDQGVVHRDIKPSNVLLGPFGEAVVLDWGEAYSARRAADGTEGNLVGTPSYMAPEQAHGAPVQPTLDVYALGALLYHVVAGRPPYQGDSLKVLAELAAGPPPPVEKHWPEVPPELAAIISKAMARQAEARYPSARELAADLRRFETGQLVSSYAYSPWALLRRWVRRHALTVAVAAGLVVALAVTAVVSYRRVVQARSAAERRRDSLILVQARTALARDPTNAVAWLKQYPPGGADWTTARGLFAEAMDRGVAAQVHNHATDCDTSSDGRTLALIIEDQRAEVWRDGRRLRAISAGETEVLAGVGVSPDGRQLALVTSDGAARLWEVDGGEPRQLWKGGEPDAVVGDLVWSPDGRHLSVHAAHDEIWIYSVAGGAPRRHAGHTAAVYMTRFSADGKWLASGSSDGTVRLWPVEAGEARILGSHQGEVRKLRFSPDGRFVVSAGTDGALRLWSTEGGPSRLLASGAARLQTADISPDGKTVASVGDEGVVRLYDEKGARELGRHAQAVRALGFSTDGTRLVTGCDDGSVRVWDLASGDFVTLHGHRAPVVDVRLFGSVLYSRGLMESLRAWRVPPLLHRRLVEASAPVFTADWSADGKWLAAASVDKKVRLCDAASTSCRVLGEHPAAAVAVAFSPDSRRLASSADDGSLRVWSLEDGSFRHIDTGQGRIKRLIWSPDGRRIVCLGNQQDVKVWEVERGEGRVLWSHAVRPNSASWSPDGKRVASSGQDPIIKLGDLEGHVDELRGHTGWVFAVAFSPDGKWLASASMDHTVRIWDATTRSGRILGRLENGATAVVWSPDGEWVAGGGFNRTARLWRVATGEARALVGHDATLRTLAFSRDGRLLASGSDDQTVRIWEVATGAGRVLYGHTAGIRSLAFSPDGDRLVSSSLDKTARVWQLGALPPLPRDAAAMPAAMRQATLAELDARDQLE